MAVTKGDLWRFANRTRNNTNCVIPLPDRNNSAASGDWDLISKGWPPLHPGANSPGFIWTQCREFMDHWLLLSKMSNAFQEGVDLGRGQRRCLVGCANSWKQWRNIVVRSGMVTSPCCLGRFPFLALVNILDILWTYEAFVQIQLGQNILLSQGEMCNHPQQIFVSASFRCWGQGLRISRHRTPDQIYVVHRRHLGVGAWRHLGVGACLSSGHMLRGDLQNSDRLRIFPRPSRWANSHHNIQFWVNEYSNSLIDPWIYPAWQ